MQLCVCRRSILSSVLKNGPKLNVQIFILSMQAIVVRENIVTHLKTKRLNCKMLSILLSHFNKFKDEFIFFCPKKDKRYSSLQRSKSQQASIGKLVRLSLLGHWQ